MEPYHFCVLSRGDETLFSCREIKAGKKVICSPDNKLAQDADQTSYLLAPGFLRSRGKSSPLQLPVAERQGEMEHGIMVQITQCLVYTAPMSVGCAGE